MLERLVRFVRSESGVVAAWLVGSLGRGHSDALSDIDLWVVVRDEEMANVRHSRSDFIQAGGEPLLRLVNPQNAPQGGVYELVLYNARSGTLQVDWYWQAQSTAIRPASSQLLFDRVGLAFAPLEGTEPALTSSERAALLTERVNFFWAMSQIAAKKVARGESWAGLNMLNLVGSTLEELKWLVGLRNDKPDYTYQAWDAAYIPVRADEQLRLLKQQQVEMEAEVISLVTQAGGVIPWQVIAKVKGYYSLIEELVKEDIHLR